MQPAAVRPPIVGGLPSYGGGNPLLSGVPPMPGGGPLHFIGASSPGMLLGAGMAPPPIKATEAQLPGSGKPSAGYSNQPPVGASLAEQAKVQVIRDEIEAVIGRMYLGPAVDPNRAADMSKLKSYFETHVLDLRMVTATNLCLILASRVASITPKVLADEFLKQFPEIVQAARESNEASTKRAIDGE